MVPDCLPKRPFKFGPANANYIHGLHMVRHEQTYTIKHALVVSFTDQKDSVTNIVYYSLFGEDLQNRKREWNNKN